MLAVRWFVPLPLIPAGLWCAGWYGLNEEELMKPRRIILIRHGECHANTDEFKFATEPDYTIELTEKDLEQARQAGLKLKPLVGAEV